MGIDESLVNEIVRRILTVAQPDKIILFGSAATGEMTPDSDIDLLVVMRDPGDRREEYVRIRKGIGDLGYPFDVIIIPTDWFEDSKEVIGGIAYPANKYGKVIYAVPKEEVIRIIVGDWLKKADQDFMTAEFLLAGSNPFPYHSCFHSQQTAEKYLKAFLTRRQVEFPKTHNIKELLDLISKADANIALSLQSAEVLSPYDIDAHDPGDLSEPTIDDAEEAFTLAKLVRETMLNVLNESI